MTFLLPGAMKFGDQLHQQPVRAFDSIATGRWKYRIESARLVSRPEPPGL